MMNYENISIDPMDFIGHEDSDDDSEEGYEDEEEDGKKVTALLFLFHRFSPSSAIYFLNRNNR